MVLNGEPGWICLMCCNIDSEFKCSILCCICWIQILVFFSVLVLHWITSKDNASTISTSQNGDRVRSFETPASPKRLVPRPPLAELAAYERGLREWQRMTGVTTVVTAKDADDEMGLDHVRPDRLSIRTVNDEQQSGKSGSTDDLFQQWSIIILWMEVWVYIIILLSRWHSMT